MTRLWPTLFWTFCIVILGSAYLFWPHEEARPVAPAATSLSEAMISEKTKAFFQHLNEPKGTNKTSLAAQVDGLMATGRADDALAAYKLLDACAGVTLLNRQHMGDTVGIDVTVEEACGDISQVQLRQQEVLLEKAVKADVPGALREKFMYGPLKHNIHPLSNNPDDPLVREWKTAYYGQLLDNAERTGSYEALDLLVKVNREGEVREKDDAQALAYHLARIEVASASTDQKLRDRVPTLRSYTDKLSKGLAPEQVAAANAAARTLLAKCCKK